MVGSRLIGQAFDARARGPASAAGDAHDACASGASNRGLTSQELADAVQERVDALLAAHPGATTADIPGELRIASGSGLGLDISPAAAAFQVDRVATARRLDPAKVRELVRDHTRSRPGFLGEPRVNVLELNLALDTVFGR